MRARLRPIGRLLLLLVLTTSLTACGGSVGARLVPDRAGLEPRGTDLVRSEVIFGRSKPDGSTVSEEQWQAFLAEHVTPRFPDGLTVIDATGQYRARAGQLVKENVKIILIVHQADEKSRAAIQEIRMLYKTLFDQVSVLLITSISRVSF